MKKPNQPKREIKLVCGHIRKSFTAKIGSEYSCSECNYELRECVSVVV